MGSRCAGGLRLVSLLLVALLLGDVAMAQARTEVRDALRGLSFVSEQLSDQQLNELDVLAGQFPDSDRLAVGLSAMIYDNTDSPAEYVLWLRHEGRRWLTFSATAPVSLRVDGDSLSLDALRQSQPSVEPSGRFLEKLEYRLTPAELATIGRGADVRLRLRSDTGTVEKRLSADERRQILAFAAASGDDA